MIECLIQNPTRRSLCLFQTALMFFACLWWRLDSPYIYYWWNASASATETEAASVLAEAAGIKISTFVYGVSGRSLLPADTPSLQYGTFWRSFSARFRRRGKFPTGNLARSWWKVRERAEDVNKRRRYPICSSILRSGALISINIALEGIWEPNITEGFQVSRSEEEKWI